MPRYAALLRGVSPSNASSAGLKRAFETAGFSDVRTVLASGNVVFSAPGRSTARLAAQAEEALLAELGTRFQTWVRPIAELSELIASQPYDAFALTKAEKRVITFFTRAPTPAPKLPVQLGSARILHVASDYALSAYVPEGSPVFMTLIEKTLGKAVTTRTWDTLQKIVRAASA